LLRAGVSFFLDLTEEGEYALKPYAPLLHKEAVALGCSRASHHLIVLASARLEEDVKQRLVSS